MSLEIHELIEFNNFNSKNENLYLIQREAPTPEEKSIIEDIPYMQGVLDFSMLLGERIFTNREITYTFQAFNYGYDKRKWLEQDIKRKLMMHDRSILRDTHDYGYYWLGKCQSVEVEDAHETSSLIATIIFNVYPFMFTENQWFDDVWDTFNFERDVANFTKYEVTGKKNIMLYNTGSVSVSPQVITTSNMKVTIDGEVYDYKSGTTDNLLLRLKPGMNNLTIQGTGIISFHFRHEVMG